MEKRKIRYGGMIFEKEESEAIKRVLKRNWWVLDIEGKAFEKELAKATQKNFAIFVNSGSSALLLTFEGLNLLEKKRRRNQIIIPATLFPTAVTAILKASFEPVVVDSRKETLCINEDEVQRVISDRTLGILVVTVAGNIPNLSILKDMADKFGCYLILDNCDGFGGSWKGVPIETFSDISVTSFHAAHIISTGQGGAVFCDNEELFKIMKSLRDWGRMIDFNDEVRGISPLPEDYQQRYTYTIQGYNLNPIELQAAIGRAQLKKLARFKKKRKENFEYLTRALSDIFFIPHTLPNADCCWFTLPLLTKKGSRKKIFKTLYKNGIEYRNILAGNIVLHPAFRKLRVIGGLEGAQEITERGFWIPIHPSILKKDLDYMIEVLRNV